MRPSKSLKAYLIAATLIAGCTGQILNDPGDSQQIPAPTVAAPACTQMLASGIADANGIKLAVAADSSSLKGARLEVPAGAVPAGTKVSLALGGNLTVQGTAHPPSICVIADVPTFSAPAFLVMPYDPARLNGLSANYLQMARADDETQVGVPMGGLLAIDEANRLAGKQIQKMGAYVIVTIGNGLKSVNPNLNMIFVIDNSGSMIPKQNAINAAYPQFFEQATQYKDPIVGKCINYHIGVLSTDMGTTETNFGDNGRLQNTFCNQRSQAGWSADAVAACQKANCSAVTPLTTRYISRNDAVITPAEQEAQFRCIAALGDTGSGIEMPLESLNVALHSDPDVSNNTTGFFGKDDLNAIFYLTDEGDSSLDSDPMNPGRHDFFSLVTPCDAADPAQPSCYPNDYNYRCLGVALKCDQLMTSPVDTMLTNCVERTTSVMKSSALYAQDLKNFITNLGNPPMPDPNQLGHLFIRALWPLPQDYMVTTMLPSDIDWKFDVNNKPPSNTLGTDAFCYDPATLAGNTPILGHPTVRLNNFVAALAGMTGGGSPPIQAEVASICDPNARSNILADLAQAITQTPMICPMDLGG